MEIAGLQSLTLLDYPGKVACTVFFAGCNLRCPYCHNAALVLPGLSPPPRTEESLLTFLQSRRGKLDGVCLTGGEPTLQKDLPALIRKIRAMGFLVKLDTNGTRPEVLKALLDESLLDYVAMDIKNAPDRYAETCGADVLDEVEKSVALLRRGTVPYEFRTTVAHPYHTPRELAEIGRWLSGTPKYFIQPFVDSGSLVGRGAAPLSPQELGALLMAVLPQIPGAKLRGI